MKPQLLISSMQVQTPPQFSIGFTSLMAAGMNIHWGGRMMLAVVVFIAAKESVCHRSGKPWKITKKEKKEKNNKYKITNYKKVVNCTHLDFLAQNMCPICEPWNPLASILLLCTWVTNGKQHINNEFLFQISYLCNTSTLPNRRIWKAIFSLCFYFGYI